MNTVNINIEGDIRIILAKEIYNNLKTDEDYDDLDYGDTDDYEDDDDESDPSGLSVYVEGLPNDVDHEIADMIIYAAEDALRELIAKTSAGKTRVGNESDRDTK